MKSLYFPPVTEAFGVCHPARPCSQEPLPSASFYQDLKRLPWGTRFVLQLAAHSASSRRWWEVSENRRTQEGDQGPEEGGEEAPGRVSCGFPGALSSPGCCAHRTLGPARLPRLGCWTHADPGRRAPDSAPPPSSRRSSDSSHVFTPPRMEQVSR